MEKIQFSNGFLWGAATSSHQVEGNNHNDWTEWELANAKIKSQRAKLRNWPDYILARHPNPLQAENYISGRACDHYNRFREDFDIAKSLGHNAHRFSIEWSRIEPEEGRFNGEEIAHYREVVTALRERGMEPFVTLWHWTLPLWLAKKDGVLAKNFPHYFSRYVECVVRALGKDVKFWMTLNEPEVYAGLSYFKGIQPPQKRGLLWYVRAISRLIAAHRRAYPVIKKIQSLAQIGIVCGPHYFESAGGVVNNLLKHAADTFRNYYVFDRVRDCMDFIGCNYYLHDRIDYGFSKNESGKVSDLGWELYPQGIEFVLRDLSRRYKKPTYITENGLADAQDLHRAWFVRETLAAVQRALAGGADVRGYFHWSLLDNFELPRGDGFWPRFGLVDIDYSPRGGSASGGKTLTRTIRPSALVYKKICESNSLS